MACSRASGTPARAQCWFHLARVFSRLAGFPRAAPPSPDLRLLPPASPLLVSLNFPFPPSAFFLCLLCCLYSSFLLRFFLLFVLTCPFFLFLLPVFFSLFLLYPSLRPVFPFRPLVFLSLSRFSSLHFFFGWVCVAPRRPAFPPVWALPFVTLKGVSTYLATSAWFQHSSLRKMCVCGCGCGCGCGCPCGEVYAHVIGCVCMVVHI